MLYHEQSSITSAADRTEAAAPRGRSSAPVLADRAEQHLAEMIAVQSDVRSELVENIVQAAVIIGDAFASGHKLMLCGNGGSAADSQHVATEFVSRLHADLDRPALPALALTTDTSFLTAYSNDFSFSGVFARQIQAFGESGDILLAISTSGRSKNVAIAIEAARASGIRTIGLFGEGGRMEDKVDLAITVPSRDTQVVQECMLPIEHLLCELVDEVLFADSHRGAAEQRC